jgi:hypothetical protein
MLKRIPIETSIGGTNREELLPNLGAAAADKGVSLEWARRILSAREGRGTFGRLPRP